MHTVRASVPGYLGTSQGLTEGAERFFDLAVQRKDIVLKGNLRPVMGFCMGTRQMALNIVNMMSDEQLTSFVNLFSSIVSDIPNEETEAAMEEAEALLNDPHAKTFSSVDELFAELRS